MWTWVWLIAGLLFTIFICLWVGKVDKKEGNTTAHHQNKSFNFGGIPIITDPNLPPGMAYLVNSEDQKYVIKNIGDIATEG